MKIYMMRHGQTDWNLLGKVQGRVDVLLNDEGRHQADQAREAFEKLNIDLIICSPLKRTRQTADIINRSRKIDVIYSESLIERDLGEFQGMSTSINKDKIYNCNLNLDINGIEPVVDLCNRVFNLLNRIKESGKCVLLVTHSGTARAIEGYFFGMDKYGNLPPETLRNCEIKEYVFNEQ